jgi:hypothetical protein
MSKNDIIINKLKSKTQELLEELQNLTNITKKIDTKYSHLRKVFVNTHIVLNKNTKQVTVMHNKQTISNKLLTFLELPYNTKLTRSEAMRMISKYCKDGDLGIGGRQFIPDQELLRIFKIKNQDANRDANQEENEVLPKIYYVEIDKYIRHHFSK